MHFAIDCLNRDLVTGWALDPQGIDRIEIYVDGIRVGHALPTIERQDVAAAFPDLTAKHGARCGFLIPLPNGPLPGAGRVRVRIISKVGTAFDPFEAEIANVMPENVISASQSIRRLSARAPFPNSVMAALIALRGETYCARGWTKGDIEEAISDLQFIVRHGSKLLPGIYPYLRYLAGLWAQFIVIRDHFPRVANFDSSAKDSVATTNSIEEMITIAHHLYVLHEAHVSGTFVEFGCFRGFSTSMLSNACFELGLTMDVFDSFAGLPPSDSAYYRPGDFAGSFDQVRANVGQYGRIGCVRFHKGFFSDTVPNSAVRPMCIWQDVDLSTSSDQVMQLLPRLPEESCVFSHECAPRNFSNGLVIPGSGPDDVIRPVVEAFARASRTVTGRFLSGCTGAFWDAHKGHPVLPTAKVLSLLDLK